MPLCSVSDSRASQPILRAAVMSYALDVNHSMLHVLFWGVFVRWMSPGVEEKVSERVRDGDSSGK